MTYRVLLIAESCNPEWVSVPLVGWSHSQAIRQLDDVDATLVTQVRNRAAIERCGLREGVDFHAIDTEKVAAPAHKLASFIRGGKNKGWTTVAAISAVTYPYFERCVWRKFGQQIRAGAFHVVHRLTPLSPATPSYLAKKCREAGVPFVLGPLNGGVPWPKGFGSTRRQEREWLSYVRSGYKLMPGYRSTREHATAIIIASTETWRQIPGRYHEKCIYIPENGIDSSRFVERRVKSAEVPLKLVFVGRLVPCKGVDMLLEASAPLMRAGKVTLTLVGDGPTAAQLRSIITKEQIAQYVNFVGQVPHHEVQSHLVNSDVFVFPSIRDFGGGVVLEAMSVGLVPFVVRYGGPGELVADGTGFLIEIGSRDQLIARFRAQLEQLVKNPTLIDQKAQAALSQVGMYFTWDAKAQQVREVYQWVCGDREKKPSWGMPFQTLGSV